VRLHLPSSPTLAVVTEGVTAVVVTPGPDVPGPVLDDPVLDDPVLAVVRAVPDVGGLSVLAEVGDRPSAIGGTVSPTAGLGSP
jgi:hypothetical protein